MPSNSNPFLMDRRKFLTHTSLALAAMAGNSVSGTAKFAWGQRAATQMVEVKTAYGRLRGMRRGDLVTFKGIPYSGPVSGANRFKAPPPLVPWTSVRDAFTPGPAHRQRVLDLIASDPNISRCTLKRASGTYEYMLKRDRRWFEKTVRRRPPGRKGPRGNLFERRDQFDSELAEKVTHIIRELKSTSRRPVRITKTGVLRRAGSLTRYLHFSTDLPKTQALLDDHVETMATYRVRKIRWAVAEMATHGQAICINILCRKTNISLSLLREYKQLVLETVQELAANVDPRSFFARDT
jgi:hypothetical protein